MFDEDQSMRGRGNPANSAMFVVVGVDENVVVHRPDAQICVENHRYNSVLTDKIPLLMPCCSFGTGYCHIQKHSV